MSPLRLGGVDGLLAILGRLVAIYVWGKNSLDYEECMSYSLSPNLLKEGLQVTKPCSTARAQRHGAAGQVCG